MALAALAAAAACGRVRYDPLHDARVALDAAGPDAPGIDAPPMDAPADARPEPDVAISPDAAADAPVPDAFDPTADAARTRTLTTDLFETGVDDTHASLPDDAPDPHWMVTVTPPGGSEGPPAPALALSPQNFCSSCGGIFLFQPQPNDTLDSRPLQASTATPSDTIYTFSTTFTVPAGAPSTARLDFLLGYDDESHALDGTARADTAVATVNGVEVLLPCPGGGAGSYNTTCFVEIPGSALRDGTNTLAFRIYNAFGPYGFRLRQVHATY